MKKITLLLLFALSLIFAGCESNKKQTVKINGQYMVELPGFLSETTELNDDASLQYANELREFYVAVIDEPKKDFDEYMDGIGEKSGLEGFSEFLIDDFSENSEMKKPELKKITFNNLNAYTANLTNMVNGYSTFWKISYIEGAESYYQLFTWTLEKNKDKYAEEMNKIHNSFKEISKDKK